MKEENKLLECQKEFLFNSRYEPAEWSTNENIPMYICNKGRVNIYCDISNDVLLGYLFYQLYINSADGSKYLGKSLPVILKNYNEHTLNHLVLYGGKYFCCMSMIEFFEFRDSCSAEIKKYLLEFFK